MTARSSRDGSSPSSSVRACRVRAYTSSASAWRPALKSAVISWPTRRSRVGRAAANGSRSATDLLVPAQRQHPLGALADRREPQLGQLGRLDARPGGRRRSPPAARPATGRGTCRRPRRRAAGPRCGAPSRSGSGRHGRRSAPGRSAAGRPDPGVPRHRRRPSRPAHAAASTPGPAARSPDRRAGDPGPTTPRPTWGGRRLAPRTVPGRPAVPAPRARAGRCGPSAVASSNGPSRRTSTWLMARPPFACADPLSAARARQGIDSARRKRLPRVWRSQPAALPRPAAPPTEELP